MLTVNIAFNVTALYVVALVVLYILVYALLKKRRDREHARVVELITNSIVGYFKKLGAEVLVSCVIPPGLEKFVAVVDTEPLKKFRCSYVIERSLIIHIHNTTGQEVEKIYWRFPMPQDYEHVHPAPGSQEPEMDQYLIEGLDQVQEMSGYQVEEAKWEDFQKAYGSGDKTPPPSASPEH